MKTMVKSYSRIWYDFVSFHIDCAINNTKHFYAYLKYNQNHFVMSATQTTEDRYILMSPRLDFANSIKSKSNNNKRRGVKKMNNINPILVYYYILNCIYCIMHKPKELKRVFNCKIGFQSNILSKDNNIFVISSNKICKLLQEYIIAIGTNKCIWKLFCCISNTTRQYFNYTDNIFANVAQLKELHVDHSYTDGSTGETLLHGATDAVCRQMCQVLIKDKDGFDCQKLNRGETTLYDVIFSNPCTCFSNIQKASDLSIKQAMFTKYFLKILGIKVDDNIENIKHEQLIENKNNPFENGILLPYSDDEFSGASLKNVNNFEVTNMMHVVLDCDDDDFLEYRYTMMNINNNNKLMEKFTNTLLLCVDECFTNNKRNYFILKNIYCLLIYHIVNMMIEMHYMIN